MAGGEEAALQLAEGAKQDKIPTKGCSELG